MKITVSSSALYSHMTAASKVLASKVSMPILHSFLIKVENNEISITASDGEKYFITSLPVVDAESDMRFCIPAKTIMDSIKELAEQPLTLEWNPETYELKGYHQTGSFSVMTEDPDPYPLCQMTMNNATELNIPTKVMMNGINRCLFATANDEIRMVMTGIFFDIKQDCIIFAGTDGRKLVRNINRSIQPGIEAGFILPKTVAAILKGIVIKDEEVSLKFDFERAIIQTSEITLVFRMVEGRFPNYNAVIPTNNPYHATVDRGALIGALKRVMVFCNRISSLVKVHLENNMMHLSGQDNDYATSAEENLMCEYDSTPISIGFSCQYMIEIANMMGGDSLTLELADPSRPGVVTPAEQDPDDEVIMLLMPMMLNEY